MEENQRLQIEGIRMHFSWGFIFFTFFKIIKCWQRMKAGEGDDGGWDGWIASLTRWTWVWASSGSWWWTGKPGVLQSMRSQRVGHNWVTELNWTDSWLTMFCLITTVKQGDLVIYTYTCFFCILFHYDLSQDIDYSSLCYTLSTYSMCNSLHLLIQNSLPLAKYIFNGRMVTSPRNKDSIREKSISPSQCSIFLMGKPYT